MSASHTINLGMSWRWFMGVCLVGACLLTFTLMRGLALERHDRDFPLYAQFVMRVFGPSEARHFSMNSNGVNMLGYHGVEGETSFYQAIHFEPVKYVEGMVYWMTRQLAAVFAVRIMTVLAAVVYFLRVFPDRSPAGQRFAGCVAACYLACPSLPYLAGFDLRPFTYLVPFVFASGVAIMYRRPSVETLMLFNLPFLAREESMILMLFLLLVAGLDRFDGTARSLSPILPMGLCWLGWVVVILGYFHWTGYLNGYHVVDPSFRKIAGMLIAKVSLSIACGCVCCGVVGVLVVWQVLKRGWLVTYRSVVRCMVLCPLLMLFAWEGYVLITRNVGIGPTSKALPWWRIVAYDERLALGGYVALLCILMCRDAVSVTVRKWIVGVLLFGFAVECTLWVVPTGAPAREFSRYLAKIQEVRPIRDIQEMLDPKTDPVLCDYETCQAFVEHRDMWVYERLPLHLAPEIYRYYPENREMLASLIKHRTFHVAVTAEHEQDIRDILSLSGRSADVDCIIRGSGFVTFRCLAK